MYAESLFWILIHEYLFVILFNWLHLAYVSYVLGFGMIRSFVVELILNFMLIIDKLSWILACLFQLLSCSLLHN